MRRLLSAAYGPSLLASVTMLAAPARATASFEFLFNPDRATDDNQFFLQTGHRVTGLPVMEVARARGHGERVAVFVADRRGRHQRGGPRYRGVEQIPGFGSEGLRCRRRDR
jgi:hypothetical protein